MRTHVLARLAFGLSLAALGLACPAPSKAPSSPPAVTISPPPAPPPAAPPGLEPPQPTMRLPHNFVPTGYEARLAIDPAKPTFEGTIRITGHVAERSSVIWLHGRHLAIHRAAASPAGDPYAKSQSAGVKLTVTPRGEDLLELRAEPALAAGDWVFSLDYTGEIDAINTTGAFVEKVAGRPYVFSQFEAIYARRVFPCVDEPDRKVPWQLTLDVPKDQVAVSNTGVAQDTPLGDGQHRVVFHKTPPLPSYLVAFGVGPFDVVPAGHTKTGVPVRIIALHGRAKDATYAAQTVAHIVDLLSDFFGIPYPYEKLDMLSIPLTVGFGAMENAGLVTMTERLILMDPEHAAWARKHIWILVASHELAHQWFGDLVTTAWWDDIWLNEGFANWMENKITAEFEPKWHDRLAELGMRDSALEADSVVSARKIRQPIDTNGDILNAFDRITYDKGASVLNMFESYVGHDVFLNGVRAYLKARAFGNATSADFVAAIGKAAGKDLAPAFSTFLDQPGAPELEVKLVCGKGGAHLELAQHRYVPPGSPTPPAGKPWIVPVCAAYDRAGKRAQACTMLDGPTGTLALDTKRCPRWVMPNVDGRGYYRTRYTTRQVAALRDAGWRQLSSTERRALFYDVSEEARTKSDASAKPAAAQLPLSLALSLVPKMLADGDRFSTGDAIGLPTSLREFVPDHDRGRYEAWLRRTFGSGEAKVGLLPAKADDLEAEATRQDLYDVVAWTGRDPALVKKSVALAQHWRDLPHAMRGPILAVAVDASPALFAKILADVRTEPDQSRRHDMFAALGGVRDPARVQQALQLLLDPAVDFRESMRMLFDTSTKATRDAAQAFFKAHLAELMKRMPQDEVSGGLVGVTRVFTGACDPARRDELARYVEQTFAPMPGGKRVVTQAIEAMDQCIANRKALAPEVRAWLGGTRAHAPHGK